jgi:hypothetical protein
MTSMEYERLGIQELSLRESQETEGGIHWLIAAAIGGIIYDIISSPGDCIKGFKDGYNS